MTDLAKLLKQKPVGSIETTLGKLWIFGCSTKDQKELDKTLPHALESTAPEVFARALAQFVCFPDGSLKEDEYKPESPVLTDSDLRELTSEDLDTFARVYVESNEHLFRDIEYKSTKEADGEKRVRVKLEKIHRPRNDDETYVDYLHRLTILERKRQLERLKTLMKPLSGFSSDLTEGLMKQLARGDALKRAIEPLRTNFMDPVWPKISDPTDDLEINMPPIDFGQLNRSIEESQIAPFRELTHRLDQLVEYSAQTIDYMVNANNLQAEIAGEIKQSGDSASLFSKITVVLSAGIIILTLIGISIAAYSLREGSRQSELRSEFNEFALQSIRTDLSEFSERIRRDGQGPQIFSDHHFGALERIALTLEGIDSGQSATQSQLERLSEENSELRAKVLELENRLQALGAATD